MKYSLPALPFFKNCFVGPFFHNCVLSSFDLSSFDLPFCELLFVECWPTGLMEVPMISIMFVPLFNFFMV